MSIVNSLYSPSERRWSTATEGFKTFTASFNAQTETRLQRPGPRWTPTADIIATSISPSGWLATASSRQVRLYNLREANRTQDVVPEATLSIKLVSSDEKVRAVALSADLLVVLTHYRILVYDEYATSRDLTSNIVEDKRIDQDHNWTPWSVAISQPCTLAMGEGALATVTVGGVGVNGVKVFRYIYKNCWNSQDDRVYLKCPDNNGAIKAVGFSPSRSNAIFGPMAFALTASNHLYCWLMDRGSNVGTQSVQPCWHIDCNPSNNDRSFPNEISSAALIISPTGRPYIICSVDHHPMSHLRSSFIVPVNIVEKNSSVLRQEIKHVPENILGPNVLAAVASPNGQFVIVVEEGKKRRRMKLLTLQGAHTGGITCSNRIQEWESTIKSSGGGASTISLFIQEVYGALEIVAVDGHRHVSFARINVPYMPEREVQRPLSFQRRSTFELPLSPRLQMSELSSEQSSRLSASIARGWPSTSRLLSIEVDSGALIGVICPPSDLVRVF